MRFSTWSFGGLRLAGVNVSCVGTGTPPPCSLLAVFTGADLARGLAAPGAPGEPPSLPRKIVVYDNITAVPSEGGGVVQVNRNTTIVSWGGPELMYVMDLGFQVGLFNVTDGYTVTINNLTMAGLATAYISPSLPFHFNGLLAQRVWAFTR